MNETKATTDRLTLVAGELDSIVADKQCSYMDACVLYCDKYKIEYELLGEVIKDHQRISAAIRREAVDLNYMKKDSSFAVVFE